MISRAIVNSIMQLRRARRLEIINREWRLIRINPTVLRLVLSISISDRRYSARSQLPEIQHPWLSVGRKISLRKVARVGAMESPTKKG